MTMLARCYQLDHYTIITNCQKLTYRTHQAYIMIGLFYLTSHMTDCDIFIGSVVKQADIQVGY